MDETTTLLIAGSATVAVGLVVSVVMAIAAKKSKDIRHRRVSRQRRDYDTSISLIDDDCGNPDKSAR